MTVIIFDDEVKKMPNPDEIRKNLEKAAEEVTGREYRDICYDRELVT